MKDLVIRGQFIRRECRIAAACLLVGILVNVGAILGYHRPWTELFPNWDMLSSWPSSSIS